MPRCPICGEDHEFDFSDAMRQRRYRRLRYEDPAEILRHEFPLVKTTAGRWKIGSAEAWPGQEPPERFQGGLFAYAITDAGQPCEVAFGPKKDLEIEEDCVIRAARWRRPVQLKGLSSVGAERSLERIAAWIRDYRGVADLNVAIIVNSNFTLSFDRLRITNPHIEFTWVLRSTGPDATRWVLHRLGGDEGWNELTYPV